MPELPAPMMQPFSVEGMRRNLTDWLKPVAYRLHRHGISLGRPERYRRRVPSYFLDLCLSSGRRLQAHRAGGAEALEQPNPGCNLKRREVGIGVPTSRRSRRNEVPQDSEALLRLGVPLYYPVLRIQTLSTWSPRSSTR